MTDRQKFIEIEVSLAKKELQSKMNKWQKAIDHFHNTVNKQELIKALQDAGFKINNSN